MPRDLDHLSDMLDSARLICEYTATTDRLAFEADLMLQDAVIRRFEVLGEAARRVSERVKELHPHLPWPQIIGIRNVVIHQYDVVDLDILWRTIREDVPELIRDLELLVDEDLAAD